MSKILANIHVEDAILDGTFYLDGIPYKMGAFHQCMEKELHQHKMWNKSVSVLALGVNSDHVGLIKELWNVMVHINPTEPFMRIPTMDQALGLEP